MNTCIQKFGIGKILKMFWKVSEYSEAVQLVSNITIQNNFSIWIYLKT